MRLEEIINKHRQSLNDTDMVIYKYIKEGVYDLDTINSELNERGLPLLGWKPRD